MKVLFLCMTEFQLLTALNAKCHLLSDCEADIIVGNYHGEEEGLAERICKTNLFRVVCSVNSRVEEKTLHAYLRGISDGEKALPIREALKNTFQYTAGIIGEKIWGPKEYLKFNLMKYNDLEWQSYDALYAYGRRPITKRIVMYLKELNSDCKIIQIDEGGDSYCHDDVGGFASDGCLLYEPKALVIDKPVIRLPKLSRTDRSFIELVNYVFDVKKEQIEDYCGDVVYFDQGVESSMPAYLKNATIIKKLIFHNAYKRHKKEDCDYRVRKKNTEDLLKLFNGRKVWVKLHPRASSDGKKNYEGMHVNIKLMTQSHVPWEVIALNTNVSDTLLVALTSSSVTSYPAVMEDVQNSKSVILYKMFPHEEDKGDDLYMGKMQELYRENFVLAEKKDDLINII